MECITQIETNKNQFGICAISANETISAVAAPAMEIGTVKLYIFEGDAHRDINIKIHSTELKAVAVNPECSLIATSSVKGTVVRITSVEGGAVLQELRRGAGTASIQNLVFHPHLNLIAVNSDRSSCHVFEIKKSIEKATESGDGTVDKRKNVQADNRKSKVKFLKMFSKYFDSEWAVSKVKIDEDEKFVGFDSNNHALTIISKERLIYFVDLPKKATRYMETARVMRY